MTLFDRGIRTNLSAIDFYVGTAKHITVGVVDLTCHLITCEVVAKSASATEHIAFDRSAIHIYIGLTGNKRFRSIEYILFILQLGGTYTYGSNLTAAIEAVTDNATMEVDLGCHYHSTFTISSAIKVTVLFEQVVIRFV